MIEAIEQSIKTMKDIELKAKEIATLCLKALLLSKNFFNLGKCFQEMLKSIKRKDLSSLRKW